MRRLGLGFVVPLVGVVALFVEAAVLAPDHPTTATARGSLTSQVLAEEIPLPEMPVITTTTTTTTPPPAPSGGSRSGGAAPAPNPGCGGSGAYGRHNYYRCQYGLSELGQNGTLAGYAQQWASQLASESPPTGCAISHSNLGQWYSGVAAAENVVCSTYSPCAGAGSWAVDAWMNSPSHRTNILNPLYHNVGVGAACAASGATYVVAHYTS